jgi:hypothetical protein
MSANILAGRIMGMDYRVWLAMLVTCITTTALFGYKHVNDRKAMPCADAIITIEGQPVERNAVYHVDRYLTFKIQMEGLTDVEWSFGDGIDKVKGQVESHKFIEAGAYTVNVTVNGHCTFEREITVEKPLHPGDEEKTIIEIVNEPKVPKVGDAVAFGVASNLQIHSYEWKSLNTDDAVQQTAVASFAFDVPGKYIIRLIVNNDPKTVRNKVIEVGADTPPMPGTLNSGLANPGVLVPAGPPPVLIEQGLPNTGGATNDSKNGAKGPDTSTAKPATPKPKAEADPATFKDMLQDVIDEKKEIEDLFAFLDYQGSTKVKVNESASLVSLRDFCKKMRSEKKNRRKIEALSFKKDDKNSIQTIQVKVPEKGRWWWPFD